jgi:chromosome segregation ATPase
MSKSRDDLTLEGLARILRDHMDGTAARFAEVGNQFAELRNQFAGVWGRMDELRGEIGLVATLVRDLTQIVARHDDELLEHRRWNEELRQYIRQVFSRMEQQDAKIAEQNTRIEGMTRDIRRILDAMERRGGDGGRRPQ